MLRTGLRQLPNVLDLPLISGFVQSSIAAAANEYVAPKSMTLNIAQLITGDGIKKDTLALGIFVITLHYAEDLSAQDSNGKSDPYIVLSYAKFGKPLYSTRIIESDLSEYFSLAQSKIAHIVPRRSCLRRNCRTSSVYR